MNLKWTLIEIFVLLMVGQSAVCNKNSTEARTTNTTQPGFQLETISYIGWLTHYLILFFRMLIGYSSNRIPVNSDPDNTDPGKIPTGDTVTTTEKLGTSGISAPTKDNAPSEVVSSGSKVTVEKDLSKEEVPTVKDISNKTQASNLKITPNETSRFDLNDSSDTSTSDFKQFLNITEASSAAPEETVRRFKKDVPYEYDLLFGVKDLSGYAQSGIEEDGSSQSKLPSRPNNLLESVTSSDSVLRDSGDGKLSHEYQICPDTCGIVRSRNMPRIIASGDASIKIHKQPWMALLGFVFIHGETSYCGGSIINSRTILTAAHCFLQGKNILYVDVLVGRASWRPDVLEQRMNATEWLIYYDYKNPKGGGSDLALLYLPESLDLSVVTATPVCIATPVEYERRSARVVGWGAISATTTEMSRSLRIATVPIQSRERCLAAYRFFSIHLSKYQLCAGGTKTDSCHGDSGSPLLITNQGRCYQVGLVSFGVLCANPNMPGVYTNVPAYHSWITKNTRPGSC